MPSIIFPPLERVRHWLPVRNDTPPTGKSYCRMFDPTSYGRARPMSLTRDQCQRHSVNLAAKGPPGTQEDPGGHGNNGWGTMLSRAQYVVPPLQLGNARNSRRPRGRPRNSQENQQVSLATPGVPRAAVAAKRPCLQAARGVAATTMPLCTSSPGGEATPAKDRLARVPLFYGSRRVS